MSVEAAHVTVCLFVHSVAPQTPASCVLCRTKHTIRWCTVFCAWCITFPLHMICVGKIHTALMRWYFL